MSLEEVALCIAHDDIVSPKAFALTYNVTLLAAVDLLTEYSRQNTVFVYYLLSGSLKTNPDGLAFQIVPQNLLQEAEDTFEIVRSRSVYSLSKEDCVEVSNLLSHLSERKSNELLAATPNCNHYLLNKYGGIYTDVMVQANGEGKPLKRSLSSSEEEQKMKAMLSSKPLTSKAASSSQPPSVKAVSSSKAVVSFFEKGTEAVKEAKEPKENKKNSSSSASVAPISSLSPNLEPLKDMEASVVGKEDKSKKVEKRSAGYGDASEDEEWDDGSGYKPDKKNLLKRRKTYGSTSNQAEELLPSNEEEKDTVTEVVEEKEESNGHEGGGGGGRLKGKKNFARGAIDDFVRDESEAGVNLADGGLAGNGAPSARPVKRRLVPKLFEDAKGYLVTEMVWEDCPEEEEKIIVEKAEPKMRAEAIALKDMSSKKKVGAARANKDEGAKGVQKSMMSFFVKK